MGSVQRYTIRQVLQTHVMTVYPVLPFHKKRISYPYQTPESLEMKGNVQKNKEFLEGENQGIPKKHRKEGQAMELRERTHLSP